MRAWAVPWAARARQESASADRVALALVILGVAVALVLVPFWPGLLNWDSAQMIAEARGHVTLDWWTAAGTYLLRGWLRVGLALPLLWCMSVLGNVVGLYGCLRLAFRRVTAAFLTLAIVVWPTTYGQLSALSRDSFSVAFSLLAFAALVRVVLGSPARGRWLALSLAMALMATLCRQNCVAVVFAVCCFWGLYGRGHSARRVTGVVLAAVAVSVGGYVALHEIGSVGGARSVYPQRETYFYDLASISTITGHDYLPVRQVAQLPAAAIEPADVSERALRRHFTVRNIITLKGLIDADVTDTGVAAREERLLHRAWVGAVEHAPVAYLWDRLRLAISQLGFTAKVNDAFLPLQTADNWHYPLASQSRYVAAARYLNAFVGNAPIIPLDIPWTYGLVLVCAFAYLRSRWRRAAAVVTAMALALITNELVVVPTQMASSWRYLELLPLVTLLALAYAYAYAARQRPGRREGAR